MIETGFLLLIVSLSQSVFLNCSTWFWSYWELLINVFPIA